VSGATLVFWLAQVYPSLVALESDARQGRLPGDLESIFRRSEKED
jgi:hypothetical protein